MIKQLCLLIVAVLTIAQSAFAQSSILDVGIRLQKTPNLYYENGISVNYSNKNLKPDRLYFGFSYVSSRLGTAVGSNAIKQDNFLISSAYSFRQKHALRPFVRANTGLFMASYGSAIFDDLPKKSLLLSADAGLSYKTRLPLKIATSLGYNLITGDGIKGPGTLYPVFYQLSLSWDIFNNRKSAATSSVKQ